jgi:hypothetical protein
MQLSSAVVHGPHRSDELFKAEVGAKRRKLSPFRPSVDFTDGT